MRRYILLTLFALIGSTVATASSDFGSPEWREEISQGYLPYRELKLSDFPISDQVGKNAMYTWGFMHYSFAYSLSEAAGLFTATVSQLSVRSGFDQNKSWRRAAIVDSRFLVHEQGHLDINELHAEDFRRAGSLKGTGATADAAVQDLTDRITRRFDECVKDAQTEQHLYDIETHHGANPDAQTSWNKSLHRRLTDAQIIYWDTPQRVLSQILLLGHGY